MFETDRIPNGWAPRLNRMNEIWVPTEFHIKVFAKWGVERSKLFAIPQAVDVNFFDPSTVSDPIMLPSSNKNKKASRLFKFLSVFKFEKRKAWDVLLDAYFTEFSSSDDVALYILTNSYHCDQGDPKCTPSILLDQFSKEFTSKTFV